MDQKEFIISGDIYDFEFEGKINLLFISIPSNVERLYIECKYFNEKVYI